MQRQLWNSIIGEYFDITDSNTRKCLISVDEAGQTQVLTHLASKLYDYIIKRVDDIDYGQIPESRGDITKIPNYLDMVDCLTVIRDLCIENKQSTYSADIVFTAIENMKKYKAMWQKAFQLDSGLPVVMYNTTCLSIVSAVSLLISTSIEYTKNPDTGTIELALAKATKNQSKNGLLFKNLNKFNESCKKGEIEKSINALFKMQVHVKEQTGAVTEGVTTFAVLGLITCIIPFLHEVTSFLYCLKQSIADYFAMEANVIKMNISKLEYDTTKTPEQRKKIVEKQAKIADTLKKWSDKLTVKSTKAEKEAINQINDDNKQRHKIEDVTDEMPDGGSIF